MTTRGVNVNNSLAISLEAMKKEGIEIITHDKLL